MNPDDQNPPLQPWIAPELEARLVAAVLGEASPFEQAELDRLLAEQPELLVFKRRIEAVHGLLGSVHHPEQPPLRLSAERRAKVLAVVGTAPARPAGAEKNSPVLLALATARRKRRRQLYLTYGTIAACFLVLLTFMAVPSSSFKLGQSFPPLPKIDRATPPLQPLESVELSAPVVQDQSARARGAMSREDFLALQKRYTEKSVAHDFVDVSTPDTATNQSLDYFTPPTQSGPHLIVAGMPPAAPSDHQEDADIALGDGRTRGLSPSSDRRFFGAVKWDARSAGESSSVAPATVIAGKSIDQPKTARQPTPVDSVSPWSANVASSPATNAYYAGNTIARTRVSTDLVDTASSFSFSTPDSLRQIGTTSSVPLNSPTTTGSAADNETIALSPFVVERSKGTGYAANNTLAGSRVQTDLKDAGSAISVVTPESLRDLGATDNQSLLNYSSATDVAGVKGNFSTAPRDFTANVDQQTTVTDPDTGEQVVVLSPFAVDAETEQGYQASTTLAGTRIRTGLPDLGEALAARNLQAAKKLFDKQGGKTTSAPTSLPNDGFLSGTAFPSAARRADTGGGALGGFPAATPAAEDAQLSAQHPRTAPPAPPAAGPATRTETTAAQDSVSTFSLHVGDASFRLAQAALARGETPDPAAIRPEEFYNAVDYGEPAPASSEKIACRLEQSAHPLFQQRNFLRIALRVPATGRGAGQPLRLTVLLDTSGSMERADRAQSVHRALAVLARLLGPADRVTLIGFARQSRLLAEDVPGSDAHKLADLAARTPYTGGTNLEEGLKLAGELARRHRLDGAQNRIVLLTDGAANLGNADPAQLAAQIATLRQQGISFDACGVGTDGLDDTILEALTRRGDGRYYVLDRPEDADAAFARQLAGALRPAAQNVKVQVRFNPARVGKYRLIGFEEHRLKAEDFRNDRVTAAELAAGESAIALYQVEVRPDGQGELGDVFVRFFDPAARRTVERSWTILYEPQPSAFDRASPALQLTGVAALLAEKLRGDDLARTIDLGALEPVVNSLRGHYAADDRVQHLLAMFEKIRRQTR